MKKKNAGFTIIEVLFVLAGLGIAGAGLMLFIALVRFLWLAV